MNWIDRQRTNIAQGCLTNSKNPRSLMYGLYPTHIKAASKAWVWDTDDQRWLDFICGLGTNFLGYGNDRVSSAIVKHVYNGYSHSLSTIHEVEAAEKIKEIFPYVDLIKFTKTGSLACDAAIRIARAYTGRDEVLSEGYHGHGDDFVSLTPPATGVPERRWINRLEPDLNNISDRVAAVIVEPVITDDSEARHEWLKKLRRACTEKGVVLIFDEVITGFRYRKYGVSNCYGIQPDLLCIGKAMANGMPLAAVCGQRDLMNGEYFISSTYAGEILSLVACKATIETLQKDHDYDLVHLYELGRIFTEWFNDNEAGLRIEGYPTRGVFKGDERKLAMYFQEMGRANILFCKSWFYNWHLAHEFEKFKPIHDEVMHQIESDKVTLKYPLPAAPYAAKVRGK